MYRNTIGMKAFSFHAESRNHSIGTNALYSHPVLALTICLFASRPASAQVGTSDVLGKVTDQFGTVTGTLGSENPGEFQFALKLSF
jgi:hypothetical protein